MYKTIAKQINANGFSDADLPLTAKNDEGQDIIISKFHDDGGMYYDVQTIQDNGWVRINRYYQDGTVTETYEK